MAIAQVYDALIPTDAASERAAMVGEKRRRPIGELVERTISLVGASPHTARAYRTGIGLFLQYLEALWAEELPPSAASVRPFAEKQTEGRRRVVGVSPARGDSGQGVSRSSAWI